MRRFHHGGFVVRPDAGIRVPKDLEGKKVGVRAYSVTTGVWTRGIFINEYDLDSSKVTWVVDDEEHVVDAQTAAERRACAGRQIAAEHDEGGREFRLDLPGPQVSAASGPPISGWDKRCGRRCRRIPIRN